MRGGFVPGDVAAHTDACLQFMFNTANASTNPMADLPGAMAVSEDAPLSVAPEFPPQSYRCPHGVRMFAYPNAERIDALRALNRGEQP